jgi:guanyl-specific ribonuclease Sa
MEEKTNRQKTPLWKRVTSVLLLVLLAAAFLLLGSGCQEQGQNGGENSGGNTDPNEITVSEDGVYDSRDEVALYLHLYGKLPQNYITKKEARSLGWHGGGLDRYAKGKCIGGDRFGNRERQLPTEQGIRYYECDIDTMGKDGRGARRIVYSDDGDIYYSDDHYRSFTKIYDRSGAL